MKKFKTGEDKYISREFQQYGYDLAKELGDLKNKSLYIKLAKETSRGFLETAKNFVKDANNVESKAKLFMWKLTQLKGLLQQILKGEIGAADGNERQVLMQQYLASQEGPLACERMVDVLETISGKFSQIGQLSLKKKLERWGVTHGLHLAKRIKSSLPGSHNRPEFQSHRYPGISSEALETKLLQFQQLLGNNRELKVEQISNVMFQIRP